MSRPPVFQFGFKRLISLALVSSLTACGAGNSDRGASSVSPGGNSAMSTLSSSSALVSSDKLLVKKEPLQDPLISSNVQIMFPTPISMSESDYVLVRGVVSDAESGVLSVSVNGIEANTQDNYFNWQVSVPLSLGVNTLSVSVTDKLNNRVSNAATATIERLPTWKSPHGVALDIANSRAIIVDAASDALVAMDLVTGISTPIPNKGTGVNKHAFVAPNGIAIDAGNNRALVLDTSLKAIIAVDLTSGAHTIFSDNSHPSSSNALVSPNGIVLDKAHNRALVADRSLGAIIAVDLTTGARSPLSNKSLPNANNALSWPEDLVLDAANNRVLVVDSSLKAVVAVDLTNGSRSVISSNSKPDAANELQVPKAIALDAANNRALVLDLANYRYPLITIDLTTGVRTPVSGGGLPDYNNELSLPNSLVLDAARNRALVLDSGLKAVVAVDLLSGARSLLGYGGRLEVATAFDQPKGLAIDVSYGRILVVDTDLKAIAAIDLYTGVRTLLSSANIPDALNPFVAPQKIVLDVPNNRALVTDGNSLESARVIAVDLISGARTVLSSNSIPNATNPMRNLQGIAIDRPRNRALVVDSNLESVIAVDLSSGARTIIASPTFPNASELLNRSQDITIDFANSRALLTSYSPLGLVSVDLDTGASSLLSPGNSIIEYPADIAIDADENRALILSDYQGRNITSLNLTTNLEDSIYTYVNNMDDNRNYLLWPAGLAFDTAHDIAFVTDRDRKAVMVIDLLTGEIVCLSK